MDLEHDSGDTVNMVLVGNAAFFSFALRMETALGIGTGSISSTIF